MLKTILKRILQSIPTLLIVVTVTFVLTRMIPGNPARSVLGPQASPDAIAELEEEMGLNKSKAEQYVDYMFNVLKGDFGKSYVYNKPVTTLIREKTQYPPVPRCCQYRFHPAPHNKTGRNPKTPRSWQVSQKTPHPHRLKQTDWHWI